MLLVHDPHASHVHCRIVHARLHNLCSYLHSMMSMLGSFQAGMSPCARIDSIRTHAALVPGLICRMREWARPKARHLSNGLADGIPQAQQVLPCLTHLAPLKGSAWWRSPDGKARTEGSRRCRCPGQTPRRRAHQTRRLWGSVAAHRAYHISVVHLQSGLN